MILAIRRGTFAALVAVLSAGTAADAVELEFNGFGDITIGGNFGNAADDKALAAFDAFADSDTPVNVNDGFGIVGTDFVVTAHLTDELTYQGEINFQTARGGRDELEIDPERFYLDYRFSEALNLQAGLYFTPIGYHNRFLYSRAWMMHSLHVPDLFEEELNLMPTHTVGVNSHGVFEGLGETFWYSVGFGNSRGATPTTVNFARKSFGDGIEATALVEWHSGHEYPWIVGISGWSSTIETSLLPPGLGMSVDPETAPTAKLNELGVVPYVTYYGRHFNVLAEGVYARLDDDLGNQSSGDVWMGGFTIELSLNLSDNKLHPYIRYDRTRLPDPKDDPFYGLREVGGQIVRTFVPEFNGLMTGVAYDMNAHVRLKVEGLFNFDGPRESFALVGQIAFGF